MTARYRIVERIYLQRSSSATDVLQQAVLRLYTTILNYLIQAKRYFQQRTGTRILKSGVLVQTDFQDLLDRMDADEREADRCADLVKTEMTNDAADQFANMSLEISNIALLRDALDRMEQPISQTPPPDIQRREILDWLSSQPYYDHHTDINPKVLKGTCQWVVQHPDFVQWQNDSKNTLLWLHGMQGSGKSCLTSMVIDESMKGSGLNEMHSLAYFYCSRDTAEPQRANPRSILACIARQLSRRSSSQPIAPPTLALHKKLHSMDGSINAPSIAQLRDLIKELTEIYDRSMIVVDALDECEAETRGELIDALEALTESVSLVKIFVSSREEGDLRLSLQTHSGLHVTSLENGEDIRRFVEYETDSLTRKNQLLAYIRKKQAKEELTKLIKEDVISKANGMFRWAELQLQSLRGIRTEKDIRLELSRIPRDISALYQNIYDKALETTQETDRVVFHNTLKWMLSAQRNLTHQHFFHAVTAFSDLEADEIDEDFLLDLLSNFVVTSTTEDGDLFFDSPISPGSSRASTFICDLGLNPLDIAPFVEIGSYEEGIHDYSLAFWAMHCVLASEQNRSAKDLHIHALFQFFLFDDSDENCPLNCWAHILYRSEQYTWKMILKKYQRSIDRVHLLACAFGFDEILRTELNHDLDDGVKEEGTLWAFLNGHHSTAKLLLGSEGNSHLREHVLHHLGESYFHGQPLDPDLVRWLLSLVEPAVITEKVITNANHVDKQIISMLLDHNRELRVTEKMVQKCAASEGTIAAFLSREPNLEVDLDMLLATLEGPSFDNELIVSMINRIDPAVITSGVISQAVFWLGFHDNKQLTSILHLLLERAGPIHVTDSAMCSAIECCRNRAVVETLLNRGWPVTPSVVKCAARYCTTAVFQLIWDAGGGQITPQLLESAAGNLYGERTVTLLKSLLGHPVDDETWRKMMLRCHTPDTMRVLLDMKPNLRVPEAALLALAEKNGKIHSRKMLAILMEDSRELDITDSVVEAALENQDYDEHIPRLLDRHDASFITERMLLGAVRNALFGDQMTKALMHRKVQIEVPSTQLINAVILNVYSGLRILRMLEAHFGPFEFTDENVKNALSGSLNMMKVVFERQSIQEAIPSILLRTASHGYPDVMKSVLQLDKAVVTRETLIAAAGNHKYGPEMLRILWKAAHKVELCIEMFLNAKNDETLQFLIDRVDDVRFGEDVLEAAMTSTTMNEVQLDCLLSCFLDSSLPVQVTNEMVVNNLIKGNGTSLWRVLVPEFGLKVTQEMVDIAVANQEPQVLRDLLAFGNEDELDVRQAQAVLKE
ncbi:Galactose oxidase/kelch beta-propeller [Penicillium canariense]|uniref:Galactose oxidase/kelch beta-propeller n=1 Tax=Penicillium canariense TaxID=189055 RepID=A0A9W9HMD5_9EURO|nr:Galactose oxidase/kelch beta-propeller [Penicillium canariense]KAJ5152823.1 Galactose oxidase/kelch beta-propeller [Penicillium canariense]